uniref:Propep_M14 domain-containing protein n=1 Tax=Heterorhabditis bacteriophora TaxID=37862 RepID=A0A1I7WT40_HETBA
MTILLIRASPETKQQLEVLRELHDNMNEYEIDFWLTPTAIGHKADMMIREEKEEWLKSRLTAEGIPFIISINDVQQ